MGQMAVCCQNLKLSALSSRNALSVLVGALFKKFGLCLKTEVILPYVCKSTVFGRFPGIARLSLW
jgi:hypothetical protein